jgi:hypothetical protein
MIEKGVYNWVGDVERSFGEVLVLIVLRAEFLTWFCMHSTF